MDEKDKKEIKELIEKGLSNHLSDVIKEIKNVNYRTEQLEMRQIYLQKSLLRTELLEDLQQAIIDNQDEFGIVNIDNLLENFPSLKYGKWRKKAKDYLEPEILLISGVGRVKSFFVNVGEDKTSPKFVAISLFLKAKKGQEISVAHYEPIDYRKQILSHMEQMFKERLYPRIDWSTFKCKKKF